MILGPTRAANRKGELLQAGLRSWLGPNRGSPGPEPGYPSFAIWDREDPGGWQVEGPIMMAGGGERSQMEGSYPLLSQVEILDSGEEPPAIAGHGGARPGGAAIAAGRLGGSDRRWGGAISGGGELSLVERSDHRWRKAIQVQVGIMLQATARWEAFFSQIFPSESPCHYLGEISCYELYYYHLPSFLRESLHKT